MLQRFLVLFIAVVLTQTNEIKAQNIPATIDKAYSLIDDEKYDEALKLLKDIEDHQAEAFGDSCIMVLNFEKGACFYYTDHYEEALPYLKAALLRMEKMPHEDCKYLEIIYFIGSCYNHLKQYDDAEKYFRRVFIRSNTQSFKCEITTQTLSELTEVYKNLGYKKLYDACVIRFNTSVDSLSQYNFANKVVELLNLAASYEEKGMIDDEIAAYHQIIEIIETNLGKDNETYLLYSETMYLSLMLYERYEEALYVIDDILSLSKKMKSNVHICKAFENFIRLMSMRNNVEIIEDVLPVAIEYMKATPNYILEEHNLYELIGKELCKNKNFEIGIAWLEKTWFGQNANSILDLTYLSNYYFISNPAKALIYQKEIEKQIHLIKQDEFKKTLYQNIMYLQSKLDNYNEAIRYAELAYPYVKKMDDADSYARHLITWALELIKSEQKKKATNLFNEVEKLLPTLSNQTKILYYSQHGYADIVLGNTVNAITVLNKGIELYIAEKGEDKELLQTMYHNLGRAYMLQQDIINALLYLNKSKDLQLLLEGKVQQKTLDYIKECEEK